LKGAGERIVVGMSGGVDSAVAALLLVRAGYEVHGLYMSNWDEDDDYCTSAQDFQDARATAAELGIPLHRVSFAAAYRQRVFDYFLAEYRAGRTPNPDVLCNREIKFGVCLDYAARLGAQRFATGHYARLAPAADGPQLLKARDPDKDQSYFLHGVEREHFERVSFPLGELRKSEVRALARDAGLPVFDKPDSTGICFIGERPFREFLARYIATSPGDIVTEGGEVLGRHRGLAFYTLGQRGGLDPRAQRARRRAGTRSPVARQPCTGHRPLQLAGATCAARICLTDQGPLPPAGPGMPRGPARWGRAERALRTATTRGNSRAIRGVVRRREMPGWRRHRGHDDALTL
jgi:tRNA-specific 2-thiouridylase